MNANANVQTESQTPYQEVRHGFSVAGFNLLLPKAVYSEVVSQPRICAIPTTPAWFAGFINHRGDTVPVYDMALFLKPQESSELGQRKRWVLLLDEHPYMAGILLTEPPAGLVAPQATDLPFPEMPEALSPHVHDGYLHGEKVWANFNHRQFFMALKKLF